MRANLESVERLSVEVLDVSNDFFGGGVSVSGLLTGQDVVAGLQGRPLDLAVLPRSAFGYEGQQTLDGWTIDSIAQATGVRVATGGGAAELLELTLAG
jgi:NifB/MoaA-like Fe-S oxidoreductase